MKKIITFVIVALGLVVRVNAQPTFLENVSIDFVKTVAVWPLIKEVDLRWFEQGKDRMPKETVSYFNFTSDGQKSVFKRTKEAEIPRGMWYTPFADNNVVYNDYTTGTSISQKPIYEETYLVQDSLVNVKWKLTSDTRMIAGFECRKAVGILYDTVAVFAFYTDEILVNGGPEGINGLPGMILGMGVPRLHATWFATSVRIADDKQLKALAPATKGKKTTRAAMLESLTKAMKDWESWGQKMILAFFI